MSDTLFAVWTNDDGDVTCEAVTEDMLNSEDGAYLMEQPTIPNLASLKQHTFGQQPGILFIRGRIVVPQKKETVTRWELK